MLALLCGTVAIVVDMLLELIFLAWMELGNLGNLKCHLNSVL